MEQEKEFRLKSCVKHYTLDQDKTVAPTETVKKALEKLSTRFDLSHLRIVPRKDAVQGAYSYSSLSDQLAASGKGLTPEQSQASAIMEFTERYSWLHFDYHNYDGYTLKSFKEIKAGSTPTVAESYFFNNFAHLENKEALTREVTDIPLKWIKGISLLDYTKFYYPINFNNYVFTSNGLATGNVIEEAILQGLCEVIERENVYRFFEERRAGRDLDQRSIRHPLSGPVVENAAKTGIELIIKEISFDFGIPTFIVCGIDRNHEGKLAHQGCGYGTHPDPEKALVRALSEYFEGHSLMVDIETEYDFDWPYMLSKMPKKNYGFLTLYNAELLTQPGKTVSMNGLRNFSRDDIKDEIESILKILKNHKHNVIFIDKTNPEVDIPVVRLFVPTFRSLIVTSLVDPLNVMGSVYYEAGNLPDAERFLKKMFLKNYFMVPGIAGIKPGQVYKEDFQKTLQAFGGIKSDFRLFLKKAERDINRAKRSGANA